MWGGDHTSELWATSVGLDKVYSDSSTGTCKITIRVIGLFPAPSIPDWDASLSPFICHLIQIKGPKQKKEGPLVFKVLFYLSSPLKFETNNPSHLWSSKKKSERKHTERTRDRLFASWRSTRRASGASDQQIPANATKIQAESHIYTSPTFCHARLPLKNP